MPYPFKVTPGVQAARHILMARNRPQRSARDKPLSLRAAATAFGTSKSDVQRHLKALDRSGRPAFSDRPVGRPRNLDDSEDRALVAYIMWLERCGFPATRTQVEEAANLLRQSRTPPAGPVGEGWYPRFVRDHPELQKKSLVRALDRDRAGFEAGELGDLEHFYSKLSEVIQRRNLGPSQVLNADECGIRIGVIRERLEVLIVKKEKNTRHDVVAFANRESSTLVGCANAAGTAIPPFVIFKTWPTESWEVDGLDERIRFARSDTAFSNAEISLDWLRHFNRHSFSSLTKVQSLGITFEDWFGCDEFMRDLDNPDWIWDQPFFERPEEDRIWRLLIIDGFTGKTSIEFMEYCIRFDIEIFVLPAHSTHLLQPLDVGVFQLLKSAHQKVLRSHIRDGFLNFKRSDFITRFQQIFDEGFTVHNIMNGFEKSGIFPVDGTHVIHTLREKKRDILAMSTPALQSLLPKETRFSDAREVSRRIRHKYGQDFSSPTRQRFTVVDDVLAEAVTLSNFAETHIKSRHQRIAAANNKRKARRPVKPSGQYLNSVTVRQVRESLETSTQKEQDEEIRRQKREIKRLRKQHFEQYRAEWQSQWKYDINNNGRPVHISFERWLRWSGKKRDDDVISIPDPSPRASPTPEESWYYDTTPSAASHRFYERLREATRAGVYRSPLQEMPFPLSSDGVEFRISNTQDEPSTNNDIITGDTDESDDDEDGIATLDLTQEAIEEPELPPLPQPSPTHDTFTSTYHRIMGILHPPEASQESCIVALGLPSSPE